MSLRFSVVALMLVLSSPPIAFAWDGVDTASGGAVEIERGNLVRGSESIEIYDHEAGEYRDVDVESIERTGNTVEIEVYDTDSGEYRTFEMDD